MLRKIILSIYIINFSFFIPVSAAQLNKSILDIRTTQTRYFDTRNIDSVMKAAINTLQDNGFIIQNIESDLGYITARKEFRANRTDKMRVAGHCTWIAVAVLTYGVTIPIAYLACKRIINELSLHPVIVDSNVNIEQVGNRTKVRFTFVEKILENGDGTTYIKASPRKVVRYYTPEIYQEFFNQLDKNLFLENNKV